MKSSQNKPHTIKKNWAKHNYFSNKNNPLTIKGQFDFKSYANKKFKPVTNPPEKKFTLQSGTNLLNESDSVNQKHWWTPVWSGLVLDKTAKHRKAIRHGIWLYLYLLTVANRRTGTLFRRISTIAKETGFQTRSIQRWLKLLRDKNYIETHSTGRYLNILIKKWKPITRKEKK